MKANRKTLPNCVIAICVAALIFFGAPGQSQEKGAVIKNGERMMFIGNSYTANEGGVFRYLEAALEAGRAGKIDHKAFIHYGQPLSAMATDKVKAAIKSDAFDTVVITGGQLDTMLEFGEWIKKSGKKTVVFMTWENRHPGNRADKNEYTAATKATIKSMREMEKKTGATIVPVAVVYHDLTLDPPEGVSRVDYLWRPGNIHQNELGTMVNAWMFYAILTGKSPVGVDFDFPPFVVGERLKANPDIKFTPALRKALQERVWKVAQAWKAGKTHLE